MKDLGSPPVSTMESVLEATGADDGPEIRRELIFKLSRADAEGKVLIPEALETRNGGGNGPGSTSTLAVDGTGISCTVHSCDGAMNDIRSIEAFNSSPVVVDDDVSDNIDSTGAVDVNKEESVCTFCQKFGSTRNGHRGLRAFTLCEARKHAKEGDLWIVARGQVYDVSNYVNEHPGGSQALINRRGGIVDATEDYFFHSRRGRDTWERFLIGKLVSCEPKHPTACTLL